MATAAPLLLAPADIARKNASSALLFATRAGSPTHHAADAFYLIGVARVGGRGAAETRPPPEGLPVGRRPVEADRNICSVLKQPDKHERATAETGHICAIREVLHVPRPPF